MNRVRPSTMSGILWDLKIIPIDGRSERWMEVGREGQRCLVHFIET